MKARLPSAVLRATLALEQVAGRNTAPFGLQSHSTVPKFKLTGAQGRVQQDALNKAFNEDLGQVCLGLQV